MTEQALATSREDVAMKYIVTGMMDGANLRASPSNMGPFEGNLAFATIVEELAASPTKWKNVRVLDGPLAGKSGHVSNTNLTALHSEASGRLVQSAAFYWNEFDRGKGGEMDDGKGKNPPGTDYKAKVLKMWDDLGGGRPPDDNTSHKDFPWSAAGMSAFVRDAKGYDGFKFSAGHHAYIKHSVKQREDNKPVGPFWGFRLKEHKPRVGDLVVRWRGGVRTYDQVKAIMNTDQTFLSHTDVVCEIKSDFLWALGANNSDSVSRVSYKLDDNGFVKLTGDRFMIMKNMM
jgi:hypothetical protein